MCVWGFVSFDVLISFLELCWGYLEFMCWCFIFVKFVGVWKKDLDDGIRLCEIVVVGVDDIVYVLFDFLIRFFLGYFFSMFWFFLVVGLFCFDGFGIWLGIEYVESRFLCCVKFCLKLCFVIFYFLLFLFYVFDGCCF